MRATRATIDLTRLRGNLKAVRKTTCTLSAVARGRRPASAWR